jgi:hypothetical protein
MYKWIGWVINQNGDGLEVERYYFRKLEGEIGV